MNFLFIFSNLYDTINKIILRGRSVIMIYLKIALIAVLVLPIVIIGYRCFVQLVDEAAKENEK